MLVKVYVYVKVKKKNIYKHSNEQLHLLHSSNIVRSDQSIELQDIMCGENMHHRSSILLTLYLIQLLRNKSAQQYLPNSSNKTQLQNVLLRFFLYKE